MDRDNKLTRISRSSLLTVLMIGAAMLAATPGSSAQRLVLAEYFTSLF